MEAYKNYKLQRTIELISSPFRIWKYEINNIATGRKFSIEAHIEDSLELKLMAPEELEKIIEREIKNRLDQGIEGDRIFEFKYDKSL
jgi:hypothetical protein